jgi:hypothetical protein
MRSLADGTGVDWAERRVHIGLTRDALKASREWQPGAPINREYEAHLYDDYGRPVDWETTPRTSRPTAAPPGGRRG